MFQAKLGGVFILFLTCVGISCESGEDIDARPSRLKDIDESSFRLEDMDERPSRLENIDVGPSRLETLRSVNYDTYDYPYERGCDHETKISLAEVKSEVQNLKELLVGLRQRFDPDFKLPPPLEEKCPLGFQYVDQARSCYKVVYEEHNWTSADQRCRELHPEAHLVAITKEDENSGLKAYLRRELSKNTRINLCKLRSWRDPGKMLWTSGQRLNETSCTEPFVWKISNDKQLPLSYSDWSRREPNCHNNEEQCIHLRQSLQFRWNDLKCDQMLCPLCEYDPL